MNPVDITLFVLKRLWELKKLPEGEFKCRAEELLYLHSESRETFAPIQPQAEKKNEYLGCSCIPSENKCYCNTVTPSHHISGCACKCPCHKPAEANSVCGFSDHPRSCQCNGRPPEAKRECGRSNSKECWQCNPEARQRDEERCVHGNKVFKLLECNECVTLARKGR